MDTLRSPSGRPLARTTARAVAWNYLSWFLSKALVLVTTAVLARLLTPEEFGVIGFATVIITYLTVMRDLGLGGALIQRRDDIEDAADTVFWINIALGVVLSAVTAMIAPWVAGYFGEPQVTALLRVLGLTFLLQSLGTTHLIRLQRELAFARKVVPDVGQAAVRGVISIAAAAAGLGPWALVVGQLAAVATSAALAWIVMPWRPRMRFARRLVRPLTRFGAPLLGVDIIHAVAGNLDYLIVGKVLGATALGVYTLAYRLPELLLLGVVTVLNRAVFPAFATVQDDPERLRRGFLQSIRYVQIVIVPIGLEAIPVLRVLAAFALISSSMVADGDVYKAVGRPEVLAKVAVAKLIMVIPALLIGVRHGLIGVAVAHLVTTVVAKALRAVVAGRILNLPLRRIGARFAPTAAAGAVMAAAVGTVLLLTEGAAPGTRLAVAVAVGASVYVPIVVALERRALGEIIRHFRRSGEAAAFSTDTGNT